MLLASFAVLVSQFASTFATPIESHLSPDVFDKAPLVARQKGTYGGTDANINASLAGTYNCYNGGTWVLQPALDIPINEICGEPVHDVLDFTPFSLIPNADGAYPRQASDYQMSEVCFDVSANCDGTPQKGKSYVHFTGDITEAMHANRADCEYALGRTRDLCHGKNNYTRGGWFTFIDGTSYGLDPTKVGGNQ